MNNRRNISDRDLLSHGKLQPQAVDLEEAVLGAMLLEKEAIHDVAEILIDKSFYKDSHQKIYKVISELYQKSEPVDMLTVVNALKEKGELEVVGGPYYITQLTNRVASASNVEYHSRIISQKYLQREVIRICSEAIAYAYDETSDALQGIQDLAGEVSNTLMLTENNKSRKTSDIVHELVKNVHNAQGSKELTGVPTPFRNVNKRTGGWQPSDLIILAARPAMGKTSLALQLATYPVYEEKKRVLVFSLEMGDSQLVARILGQELEIASNRFTRDASKMDIQEMNDRLGQREHVYNDDLIIDDRAGLDINQLLAKAKSIHLKTPLDLIVVDYLQLLNDRSVRGSREQEISSVSRKLKVGAKELKIPIIALSQLSRSVESRGGDRRPQLSDLRESGAIEQDADIVMFLHRPEYYGLTEDENGNSTIGEAALIWAKYRNGGLGTDVLKWEEKITRFKDKEATEYEESFGDLPVNDEFDKQGDDSTPF